MKIYEYRGFPNPARIRIALAEKNMTDRAEFIAVDVPKGEHRTAEFLAKNPSGTVPALEMECGTVISECTAITEYIDHLDGRPTLTGATPKERGIIHMMQRRAETGLLDAGTNYFHHATPGLGPKLELYQNKEWGEKQRERVLAGMAYFNTALAHQPYLAGSDFSMADITAITGINFAEFVGIKIPDDHTNLKAWRERVAQRPSLAAQ
ncbi:MAG: glutathione S-transferase [Hyphomicrobium sp.]|nr:glutathione S-transferase [Hyphomicrobium sp.]